MKMSKKLIFLASIFLLMNKPVYAHKLPQELNSQLVNHHILSDQMQFSEYEINQWSNYAKTIDIEAISEQVNVPGLISYISASSNKSNAEVECSIYADVESDKISSLCGDLDDHSQLFMTAGLAAIGYCHFKQTELWSSSGAQSEPVVLVPYFKGPNSFVSSIGETTNGNHHAEYQTSHGLQFHCVDASSLSDTAQEITEEENS